MQLVKISAKRIKQLGMFPLAEQAMAIRSTDPFYQDGRMRTFFQALVYDGVILGVLGWEYNSEKLFVGPLEVNPKYRGMGVGSIMLYQSILASLSNGTKGVFLYCTNEFVEYYRRFGFKRILLDWEGEECNEMILPFYWIKSCERSQFIGEIYRGYRTSLMGFYKGVRNAHQTA